MLTPVQIQQLKNEGYKEEEIHEALSEVARDQKLMQSHIAAQRQNISTQGSLQSAFNYNPNDNLIKWQLEVNEILERAEHILREDEIKVIGKDTIWIKSDNPERILNDYGVKEIMRILSMYVNRGTILGNYSVEEVEGIMNDFGDRLNSLLYTKYEVFLYNIPLESVFKEMYELDLHEFAKDYIKINFADNFKLLFDVKGKVIVAGDQVQIIHDKVGGAPLIQFASPNMIKLTETYTYKRFLSSENEILEEVRREQERRFADKRKNFEMIWGMLLDAVHSAYTRSIGAGERSSLREARSLQQMEQISPYGAQNTINVAGGMMPKQRSAFNPLRYVLGKYK